MNWKKFRRATEKRWVNREIYRSWGYQIQPGTKWNSGLSSSEIKLFENRLGFSLPEKYVAQLQELNGFNKDCVDVHAFEGEPYNYSRRCYKYPDDLDDLSWLVEEIKEYESYVHQALTEKGFPCENIIGYVPLYGHRALVVYNNDKLTPVISIVGNDVMVYGTSLGKYWKTEFNI